MKPLKLTMIAACVASLTLASASMAATDTSTVIKHEALLAQQVEMGVLWMQQSGEYKAIVDQTFNLAKMAFDNNKAAKGMKKAVVSDLDETLIDNSAEAAWQVKNGKTYNSKDWARWVAARQATAISGAVDFANYVNSHGGKMFYVSNRKIAGLQATIDNLKALGFTGVSPETVLLKEDTSNKVPRFEKVQTQGYDIVLYMGDNLNDFTGETYHKNNAQRRAFVEQNKALFGQKYFVLPNPTYGAWESGMADGYYKNDHRGKLLIHSKTLNAWDGE